MSIQYKLSKWDELDWRIPLKFALIVCIEPSNPSCMANYQCRKMRRFYVKMNS